MNVFGYQNFIWVADLYDQANVKVADVVQMTPSTSKRAPVLNPIGTRTAVVGQSLDFVVSGSDPQQSALNFSALNLPAGAALNPSTGQFHWQPSAPGTYVIAFVARQVNAPVLSDAEIINVLVTPGRKAQNQLTSQ